jgi:hypothetical protein
MKIKRIEQFNRDMQDYLDTFAEKRDRVVLCPYTMKTKYGYLGLSLPSTMLDNPVGYTLFTRFERPSLAKSLGCNPHSGKWNFHLDIELGPIYATSVVKSRINSIYEPPPPLKWRVAFKIDGEWIVWERFGNTQEGTLALTKEAIAQEYGESWSGGIAICGDQTGDGDYYF